MTDTTARSGADILAAIRPQVRTGVAHICLRPDLVDAWETANNELMQADAEDATNKRLGSGRSARTKKLAEKVRELEDQIDAADIAFTFHAMDKSRHSEICDENPPRDGNMLDYTTGYNREAVDNAVVRECLVEPTFDECTKKTCKHVDCGSWQALLKLLNPSEWEELANVVREVNGVTSAPKSVLASRILDGAETGSRQRARGA